MYVKNNASPVNFNTNPPINLIAFLLLKIKYISDKLAFSINHCVLLCYMNRLSVLGSNNLYIYLFAHNPVLATVCFVFLLSKSPFFYICCAGDNGCCCLPVLLSPV